MKNLKSQSGYTIAEVMVVVAIVGVLAALGVPSFRAVVPRIRLSNNTMVLSNELALARMRAISKTTDFRISFAVNPANEYTLEKDIGTGMPNWAGMGRTIVSGSVLYKTGRFVPTYKADGTFDPPTWTDPPNPLNPADKIRFTANGQAPDIQLGEMAVIELQTPDNDLRRRIFVEATGRVHVWRWSGGSWTQE